MNFIQSIIEYLFPSRCCGCSTLVQSNLYFCPKCWQQITFIAQPYCYKCSDMFNINLGENIICGKCISNSNIYYDRLRSLIVFNKASRKIIHDFKYHDKLYLGKIFAEMLLARYLQEINDIDLIVPVPMYKLKRLIRMYNQAQILANEIAKLLKKPINNYVLVKNKWTKSQIYLSQKMRKQNIKGSININPRYKEAIYNKRILLIDDVVTTGTTINECSYLLKKHGASHVTVLSIGRTCLSFF